MMMTQKTIAVDFDNVLYDHDGVWRDGEMKRLPVAGAAAGMSALRDAGYKIVINSARCCFKRNRDRMAAWMDANGIVYDDIATHKPDADIYLDDKAMRFTAWPVVLVELGVYERRPAPRVILYNVGRNLNRAYRTCYSFGVSEILVVGESSLTGNLFGATGKVAVTSLPHLPDLSGALALENYYTAPLCSVNWSAVDAILIGGETGGLPKRINPLYKATIPTANEFCLTVEAALAIALYEWGRNGNKNTV